MPDVNPETRYYDDNGELEWRCKYCPKTYALSGGTAVIMDHLCDPPSEEGHGLERHAARDARAKNQSPIVNTDDAIGWWMQETQRKAYPNLSKMAFDYLSIPGMSAEPERLFSSTKITITDR